MFLINIVIGYDRIPSSTSVKKSLRASSDEFTRMLDPTTRRRLKDGGEWTVLEIQRFKLMYKEFKAAANDIQHDFDTMNSAENVYVENERESFDRLWEQATHPKSSLTKTQLYAIWTSAIAKYELYQKKRSGIQNLEKFSNLVASSST